MSCKNHHSGPWCGRRCQTSSASVRRIMLANDHCQLVKVHMQDKLYVPQVIHNRYNCIKAIQQAHTVAHRHRHCHVPRRMHTMTLQFCLTNSNAWYASTTLFSANNQLVNHPQSAYIVHKHCQRAAACLPLVDLQIRKSTTVCIQQY